MIKIICILLCYSSLMWAAEDLVVISPLHANAGATVQRGLSYQSLKANDVEADNANFLDKQTFLDQDFTDYESDDEVESAVSKALPNNISKLLKIAQNMHDERSLMAAQSLLSKGDAVQKEMALESIKNISQTRGHKDAFNAAKSLCGLAREELADKLSRAKTSAEQQQFLQEQFLQEQEELRKCEQLIIEMAQREEIYSVDAAEYVFNATMLTYKEDVLVLDILRKIMHDASHDQQLKASLILKKRGIRKDRLHARNLIQSIMLDDNHKDSFNAAKGNYSRKYDNLLSPPCTSKIGTMLTLLSCCCCPVCYFTCFVPYKLYNCLDCSKRKDFFLAVDAINYVASNADHKDAFAAAAFIIENARHEFWDGTSSLEKTIAQNTLRTIAGTPNHPNQRDAINLLRESNDPEDQRIGGEMQAQYFPEVFSQKTIKRQAQFNLEQIRAAMPKPLKDLSEVTMDLTAEFQALLNLISPIEKINGVDNPYYLAPDAIDPDWNGRGHSQPEIAAFYMNITNKAIGFIKALEGKDHSFWESKGWQMYDDNKADMINSLKHIVLSVKKQRDGDEENPADPAGALVSFGIVLNSLLYCPTGQAEGIESAVNTLVRGKNIVSTDLKELVGKFVVASAVQKAFNNAFFVEGRVHALARARMVLTPELGLSHSITSFKERIAAVSEAEKPGIYNSFYSAFDIECIIQEMRRNLQTPLEYDQITNARTTEERKNAKWIKLGKPINVGEITTWLHDADEEFNTYGISDDFKSISNAGVIRLLIKMEFLTDCKKTQRLLQRMDEYRLVR